MRTKSVARKQRRRNPPRVAALIDHCCKLFTRSSGANPAHAHVGGVTGRTATAHADASSHKTRVKRVTLRTKKAGLAAGQTIHIFSALPIAAATQAAVGLVI